MIFTTSLSTTPLSQEISSIPSKVHTKLAPIWLMAYGGKGKENTTSIGSSDDSPDTTKYTGPVSNVLRPNASNIISGHARAPYDFESFVDFLSRNHCIEILDFLSEANAYSDSYYHSGASALEERMTPETRRLGKQWKTIMSTYITPGSPNELNIPDGLRKELLNNQDVLIHPPNPTLLNPTIQHARELLADGVIIPFMNSIPLEIRSRSLSIDRYHPPLRLQVASETDTSTPRDAREINNTTDRIPNVQAAANESKSRDESKLQDEGRTRETRGFQKWWRATITKVHNLFRP